MAKIPFRQYHILQILEEYSKQNFPLDLSIYHYFRAHKALGSKDRAFIANTIYGIIRWRGLLDFFCKGSKNWENLLESYLKKEWPPKGDLSRIPSHIRVSFPKILFELLMNSYGEEKAKSLCQSSNETAPTTVRINPLKTTREALLETWAPLYEVSPCTHSPHGILFHKKINFFSLEEFQKGLFEVQDEGSQLVADLINPKPGDLVLDYCAGSGGKTLAFAHKMEQKGQIFLHDVRPNILTEARRRLKRAQIQNAQTFCSDPKKEKQLKGKMDWVLVDAPCTGTGTLRRNPDMKWRFTEETVPKLCGKQRTIFERALSFLKPGGHIVYVTCSILPQENEEQLAHFLKTYSLEQVGTPFQSLPASGEMDGFFAAIMKSKTKSPALSKTPPLPQ